MSPRDLTGSLCQAGACLFDEVYFGPDSVRDPVPGLAWLRTHGLVHRSEVLGGWVTLGWGGSRTVLKDRRVGQGDGVGALVANLPPTAAAELHPLSEHMGRAVSFLDPPEHTAQRAAAAQVLDAGLGQRIAPDLATIIEARCEEVAQRSEFDGIDDFALPITVAMLSAILGVRYEDRHAFVAWVERIFAYLGSPQDDPLAAADCKGAYGALADYVATLMAQARSQPTAEPTTLVHLLTQPGATHGRTHADLMGMLVGMVQGGFETTTTFISNAIWLLCEDPRRRQWAMADPTHLAGALEEVLRLAPSLKLDARQALVDMTVDGVDIAAGETVVACLIAANRDPEVFASPEEFLVGRHPNPHLSFGFGTHFCLGAPLARAQAAAAVGGLLRRFPTLELADPAVPWRASGLLRRKESLPLRHGSSSG